MAEPGVAGNAASDGSELAPEEHVDVSGESAAAPLLLLARCCTCAGRVAGREGACCCFCCVVPAGDADDAAGEKLERNDANAAASLLGTAPALPAPLALALAGLLPALPAPVYWSHGKTSPAFCASEMLVTLGGIACGISVPNAEAFHIQSSIPPEPDPDPNPPPLLVPLLLFPLLWVSAPWMSAGTCEGGAGCAGVERKARMSWSDEKEAGALSAFAFGLLEDVLEERLAGIENVKLDCGAEADD